MNIHDILTGFAVALTTTNIFFCFVGCLLGTLTGVLPGLGSAGAIALLIPFTIGLPADASIIMLAGIFYGAMYGGSTTSILVNIPGETSSAITCLDGYQMARQGKAGPALGISAIGSFVAGTFGLIILTFIAPQIARLALRFGPPEFFAMMFLGLTLVAYLARGSMVKAFATASFGLILSTVGIDSVSGTNRFTFGFSELFDGLALVPVLMGLFGISEVMINLEEIFKRDVFKAQIGSLLPDRKDLRASILPITRGTILGFLIGLFPGAAGTASSFLSYIVEKKLSRYPERFGTGAIEGVAGPEAANNAASSSAFIPLLTFGIPTTASIALLLGALMIHGIIPGPLLIRDHPEVFWGVIASMYLGNVMLLILNLPLIGIWVKLLKVPYGILFPLILLICIVGAWSNDNSLWGVDLMIIFGLIGYLMRKTGFEPAPLIFAYILGSQIEESFRQSLLISGGDFNIFFVRPIATTLLILSFSLILASIFSSGKRRKLVEKIETMG
jgi:putative tricarboxylic transport membrane protein